MDLALINFSRLLTHGLMKTFHSKLYCNLLTVSNCSFAYQTKGTYSFDRVLFGFKRLSYQMLPRIIKYYKAETLLLSVTEVLVFHLQILNVFCIIYMYFHYILKNNGKIVQIVIILLSNLGSPSCVHHSVVTD